MYQFVFIDLDDTLWDFHANAKSTLQDLYLNLNLQNYFTDFNQFFNLYTSRNYQLWPIYGRGEITKDELQRDRFAYPFIQVGVKNKAIPLQVGNDYLQILTTKNLLIDGAIEVLEYLYSRYSLTIISNGFEELQYKKIRNSSIEKYFNHIVLSETAKALKPDKKIFDYALKINNAKPSSTIMIGDSYDADIIGAKNAGIDQVFFNPKARIDNLNIDFSATWQINKLVQLIDIL